MISQIILISSLLILTSCLDPGKVKDPAKVVASMSDALTKKYKSIPVKFPREVTTESEFVLVDVRSAAERAVSHIPLSISIQEFESHSKKYINKEIVFYCTIGVRSTKYALDKMKEGFTVFNLKGGVLGWAHAGKNFMTSEGTMTKKVHVYSEAWNLLPEGYEGAFEQ